MITAIRRHFKSSAYRLLLFFIVLCIALGMISLPSLIRRTAAGGPWAIRVNNQEISYQEFMREVSEQRDRIAAFRAQYGQFADFLLQSMGMSLEPKSLAFDFLVKEELTHQLADKIGIYLHPNFIEQSINNVEFARQYLAEVVPPFVYDKSGVLNMRMLRTYLKRRGLSISDFERKVKRILMRQHVMELALSTQYIPEFDFKQQYIADNVGKKFSILTFSFDRFLKEEATKEISDEMLKSFFDKQNKQFRRYWVPEKRGGVMWEFEPRAYGVAISDEEIEGYYQDHKVKKFVDMPTKVQVQQMVYQKIQDASPKDSDDTLLSMEQVREKILTNPSFMADQWEHVGPFARGKKERLFERAAFLLRKEGDISSVIETDEGKVILKLVKRIPRTYKSLSQVKGEIKDILGLKEFKARFVPDIKNIVGRDRGALVDFIAKRGGKREPISDIIKDESRLAQHLFKLQKDKYAFYIDDGKGVVVQVTEIKERHLPSLDSIKKIVKDDLYEERAAKSLQTKLKEAKKAVVQRSFDQLKKDFDVPLERTDWLASDKSQLIQSLEKRDIPVMMMLELEKVGLVLVHESDRDGFLIRLDELEAFDEEQFDTMQAEVKDKLSGIRMRLYQESLVASLYRNATIETNESILMPDEEYSI